MDFIDRNEIFKNLIEFKSKENHFNTNEICFSLTKAS